MGIKGDICPPLNRRILLPHACSTSSQHATFDFGTDSGCQISTDQPHLGRFQGTKGLTRREHKRKSLWLGRVIGAG